MPHKHGRKRAKKHHGDSQSSDSSVSSQEATISQVIGEANETLGLVCDAFAVIEETVEITPMNSKTELSANAAPPDIPPPWLSKLIQDVVDIKGKVARLESIDIKLNAMVHRVEKIEESVGQLEQRVAGCEASCEFINKQYEDLKKTHATANKNTSTLKKDLHEVKTSQNALQQDVKTLSEDMARSRVVSGYQYLEIEARSRRQNLLFHGFQEEKGEKCFHKIKTFILQNLEITDLEVDLNRAHRLGPPKNDKMRPIIVSFVNDQAKEHVLQQAQTKCKGANQYVTRDFPKAISEARRSLSTRLVEARRQGKQARIIFPAKLVVDGQVVEDKFPGWDNASRKTFADVTKSTNACNQPV